MPEQINANNLLVLKSRQLVWCPVFKAASTNWMKTIPMLSNYLPAQMQVPANSEHIGASMMSAKNSDFLTPSTPCHVQNSRNLIPFVCFLGTPFPHPRWTSYMEAP